MSRSARGSGHGSVLPALLLALVALVFLVSACGAGAEDQEAANTTTTSVFAVPVQNEQCLACHEEYIQRAPEEENPNVFSHQQHLNQQIRCHVCHADLGHDGPPIHSAQVCEDCHGLTMPHPAGYLRNHGPDVLEAGGSEVCERCHNIYLHCQECHGLQMPHPDQWEMKHGEIAYPQMQICGDCHTDEFCLQCHPVVMPHPADWTRTHGIPVIEQSSEMCTTCHEPGLCTPCHGMPMPHPQGWGTSHPEASVDKRGECLLCHAEDDCTTCHEIHRTHGQGGGE